MLKFASRAEAPTEERRFADRRSADRKPGDGKEGRRDGRDGLKAALVRTPVVAAVDLGAAKVACFIMKPDGVRRATGP